MRCRSCPHRQLHGIDAKLRLRACNECEGSDSRDDCSATRHLSVVVALAIVERTIERHFVEIVEKPLSESDFACRLHSKCRKSNRGSCSSLV